jgi:hypothetical protein
LSEFLLRVLTPSDTASCQALDQGLLAWLHARQKDGPAQRREFGLRSYTHDLCQAFISIYSLKLAQCAYQLREQWSHYRDWLTPLTVDSSREPVLHMLRVLALCPDEDDVGLLPLWTQLVVRSGDAQDHADYPSRYLHLGLRGIRALPNAQDDNLNKRALLTALAYRAAQHFGTPRQSRALEQFKTVWSELKDLYLSTQSDYWRTLENETFNALSLHREQKDILIQSLNAKKLNDLRSKMSRAEGLPNQTPFTATSIQPPLTGFDAALALLKDKSVPAAQSWPKLQTVLDRQLRFAQTTGDVYYYTRTLSNLGERWARKRVTERDSELLNAFEPYALQGITLDPGNPYMWMVWVSVLQKQQRHELLETVLWDMHRRFPEQEPGRVELARLYLYGPTKRYSEAEALLQEVANANPKHEPSRVELARLYLYGPTKRYSEAEALLQEVANPKNEPSRVELAKLYFMQKKVPQAVALLETFLNSYPHNRTAKKVLADLQDPKGGHAHMRRYEQQVEQQMRSNSLAAPQNKTSQETVAMRGISLFPSELQDDLAQLEKAFFSQRYGDLNSQSLAKKVIEQAAMQANPSVQALIGTRQTWGLALQTLAHPAQKSAEPSTALQSVTQTLRQDLPGSYAAQATAVFFATDGAPAWQALQKKFPHQFIQTILLQGVQEKHTHRALTPETTQKLERLQRELQPSELGVQVSQANESALAEEAEARRDDSRLSNQARQQAHLLRVIQHTLTPDYPLPALLQQAEYLLAA